MRFGLKEKDIKEFVTLISNDDNVEEIILFGSRAKGNFRNGSDIDLVIKGRKLEWNSGGKFEFDLDETWLPYKFDVLIYHKITEPALVEHIDRAGISLFKRDDNGV